MLSNNSKKSGLKLKPSNNRALKLIITHPLPGLSPTPTRLEKSTAEKRRGFFSARSACHSNHNPLYCIALNDLDSVWDVPFNF